jgi:hypothetical protein
VFGIAAGGCSEVFGVVLGKFGIGMGRYSEVSGGVGTRGHK